MATCAGCRGYAAGYMGEFPLGAREDHVSYHLAYRVGDRLRLAEWADGTRSRDMFDLDIPDGDRPVFVPRIPQVCSAEQLAYHTVIAPQIAHIEAALTRQLLQILQGGEDV